MLTVSPYIGSDQPLGSSGGIRGELHIGGRPNERYTEAIIRLNKIFSLEGELSSLTPEDRKKQRIIREQSELEAFWIWDKKNAVSSSKKFAPLSFW